MVRQFHVYRYTPGTGKPGLRKARTNNDSTHGSARGLLLLLLSTFALLVLRAVPSGYAEGWVPLVSLIAALALIVAAMIAAVRTR